MASCALPDPLTVTKDTVIVVNDELQVTTGVKRRVDNQKIIPGRFKAGYLLWWK